MAREGVATDGNHTTVSKLDVLIIGGGIAGLSCAIALRRAGHDVHLVELDKEWRT